VSRRDGNWEVYVLNADGSGLRNLTRSAAPESGSTWSPDGRKIAFGRSPDGRSTDIYVMNADGTGQRRLARNAGWMVWAPAQTK
jgi:TolB protein